MIAVITGATQGIGKAIAERFAKEGFNLIITSRKEKDLEKFKKALESKHKIKVYHQAADLSDNLQTKKFTDFVLKTTKSVDVLVNNVGVYIPGNIFENTDDEFVKQLNVNLLSAHIITHGLMPVFEKQKKGHIFTLGSILSVKLRESAAFYTISKHALRTWHQLLLDHVRDFKVKATMVLPSSTITASWGKQPNEKEFIQPEEIAEAIYNCYSLPGSTIVDEISVKTISKKLE